MTTTLVSATIFDLSEILCKGNRMINYSAPSTAGCLLDKKAVGTPASGGFPRRHSVILPSSKFHQNQLLSSLKGEPAAALSSRDSSFQDRSFSEGGERLLPAQKQPGSGPVNSSRYKTELCRPFEENGASRSWRTSLPLAWGCRAAAPRPPSSSGPCPSSPQPSGFALRPRGLPEQFQQQPQWLRFPYLGQLKMSAHLQQTLHLR
uniref:Tis11B-like protein N-terminal domain-containing protein n=1 Tax=Oryctolagus cuniculus TaxID=9986 RepID=A0A5F9CUN5_RABIT